MNIAIITGASSGLGEEFVRQLSPNGLDEIWVIARRRERLEALQDVTPVKVRPVPMDLTKQESIDSLKAMLELERPRVRLLINAAGLGKIGSYKDISVEDQLSMIDLNCRAAVAVTLLCIPYMQAYDRIMEICSTAGFQPFPYLGVYSASKSFLYRFSRALRFELWSRKIFVTAVCPYWIKDTEFIPVAQKTQGKKAIRHFILASKKSTVVKLSLLASACNFAVCTPGIMCTIHRIVAKFVPSFLMNHLWNGLRRL